MAKRIIKPDSGNTLVIQEDNGSIDALTVETNGNITLAEKLIIDPAKGIQFRTSTGGSGTFGSGILDDYEEGTWNATLASGATTTPTATGYYTKIGRVVDISFNAAFGSITLNGTAIQISGLPFPTSSNGNLRPSGSIGLIARAQYQSSVHHFCRVEASSTTVLFQYASSGSGSAGDLLTDSSGTYVPNYQFALTYFTD